jgi:non-ribosomal peptide synthetase component F
MTTAKAQPIVDQAEAADLAAALRNAIVACWVPPREGPHPERLIVTMELFLNRDGSVARPPQLSADSAGQVTRDPHRQAAAAAAQRAILTCAPYKLPADKYDIWNHIVIDFDPRKMVQ